MSVGKRIYLKRNMPDPELVVFIIITILSSIFHYFVVMHSKLII